MTNKLRNLSFYNLNFDFHIYNEFNVTVYIVNISLRYHKYFEVLLLFYFTYNKLI